MITKQTLNITDGTSMELLLALEQFFIEQQPSLFGYTCAANMTIKMLYGLATDYVLQGKEHRDSFADAIDVICDTHIKKTKTSPRCSQ